MSWRTTPPEMPAEPTDPAAQHAIRVRASRDGYADARAKLAPLPPLGLGYTPYLEGYNGHPLKEAPR